MYTYVFILGAQGSGKTTIARLLKEKLNSPHIDFDWIRGFHVDKYWSNISENERKMSLGNLLFLIKNYKKHKYHPVIVSGFTEEDIREVLDDLKDEKYLVITLFLTSDMELRKRVLTESRDSGFRDYTASIEFNKKLREELTFPNEYKIDNTSNTPEITAAKIITLLEGHSH